MGQVHVNIVDSRHFCLCLQGFVVMGSNIGIELGVAAGEGSDVSGGVGLYRYSV